MKYHCESEIGLMAMVLVTIICNISCGISLLFAEAFPKVNLVFDNGKETKRTRLCKLTFLTNEANP